MRQVYSNSHTAFELFGSDIHMLIEAGADVVEHRTALREAAAASQAVRKDAKALIARAAPGAELKDADYVFLGFVLRYLPSGIIGLLIAVIFCAAMSSTSSELSALGSTSMLDFYQRIRGPQGPERSLLLSKLSGTRDQVWSLVEPYLVPGRELKARYAFEDLWELAHGPS